jgi:hypothetical protein
VRGKIPLIELDFDGLYRLIQSRRVKKLIYFALTMDKDDFTKSFRVEVNEQVILDGLWLNAEHGRIWAEGKWPQDAFVKFAEDDSEITEMVGKVEAFIGGRKGRGLKMTAKQAADWHGFRSLMPIWREPVDLNFGSEGRDTKVLIPNRSSWKPVESLDIGEEAFDPALISFPEGD